MASVPRTGEVLGLTSVPGISLGDSSPSWTLLWGHIWSPSSHIVTSGSSLLLCVRLVLGYWVLVKSSFSSKKAYRSQLMRSEHSGSDTKNESSFLYFPFFLSLSSESVETTLSNLTIDQQTEKWEFLHGENYEIWGQSTRGASFLSSNIPCWFVG